jgi:hypothetical protein
MKKESNRTFHKTLLSILFIFGLSLYLLFRSEKPKTAFQQILGKIESISVPNDIIPARNPEKYRNLKLTSSKKIFQVFIGQGQFDFKPKLEKIAALKSNDSITIFFENDITSSNDSINRLVQFIDRGKESVFIKGRVDEYLGHFLAIFTLLSFVILYTLKKRNVIT